MGGGSEGKRILVINDTPEILDLFADLLGGEGHRVTTDRFTVEMAEMLERARNVAPDLIVLDFIIGGEGQGWQFLQLLKMDRQTRDVPVVVCTAAVSQVEELKSHLDEMGVAVMLKPFDIDHLLAMIEKALRRSDDPARALPS